MQTNNSNGNNRNNGVNNSTSISIEKKGTGGVKAFFSRLGNTLAKDLWILILDIVAVNLAYFLALMIRFYVNFQFRPTVSYYLTDFAKFAPFYTVLCIAIFALFKLYNGMWRYAGINDMNRIIAASFVTCLIQIVGTVMFVRRMPITYYVIGALLQFFFVVIVRFAYRFIIVEQRKIAARKVPFVNAIIVGAGELGKDVLRQLEDDSGVHPIAIVDCSDYNVGRMLDGLPIISISSLESVLNSKDVKSIFIADKELAHEQRTKIKTLCAGNKIECTDYTGYMSNLGSNVSLTNLLELVDGPVFIYDGIQEQRYDTGREAIYDITESYFLSKITSGSDGLYLTIKPNRQVSYVLSDDDQKAYIGYDKWPNLKN